MVNNPPAAAALQDHGPRNTDIRDLRKVPQKDLTPQEPPELLHDPKSHAVPKSPDPSQPPPPPPPQAAVENQENEPLPSRQHFGGVVDIFRNGKPPKKRRPTTTAEGSSSSERTCFAEEDFNAFDRLPENKRDCLYFVAQLKQLVSPDSTVIDYLSRIDLVKVNKLMHLTKAIGGKTERRRSDPPCAPTPENDPPGPLKRSSETDVIESSRKKARQAEGSVFSFGETSPSGQKDPVMVTPLPLTRNSDANLFVDFGTSMAISTAGQSLGRGSLMSADTQQAHVNYAPPSRGVDLRTEPGLMDFLAFVREKCYSYSQIRRMCVADGILKEPQISRLLINLDKPLPFTNWARLKYLTMIMLEMGNKLESSFADFSALQVRRSDQLGHIAKAEKFVRKCFLIKLSSDTRSAAEAEISRYINTVFVNCLTELGIVKLLRGSADSPPLNVDDVMVQDTTKMAKRLETMLQLAYSQDTTADQSAKPFLRESMRLRDLRRRNQYLRNMLKQPVDISKVINERVSRLGRMKNHMEEEKKEANRRVIFDDDGVDIFLKRTQLEIRNSFITRLNDKKHKRFLALPGSSGIIVDDALGLAGSVRLSLPECYMPLFKETFGMEGTKEVEVFAGVCLSTATKSPRPKEGPLSFDPESCLEPELLDEPNTSTPDQKWCLYKMKQVPLTPVKRRSED